jgi:hypothetical protein
MRPENVNIKDTSMDSAFGVEMEMGKPGKVAEFPTGKFNPSKEIPESLSSGFMPTSPANTPPSTGANGFFNDNFAADVSEIFARGTTPSWEVAPAIITQQQEKAQKISDEFDAAWVAMPSTSFFPEDKVTVVQTDKQPGLDHGWPPLSNTPNTHSRRRVNEPGDLDQSFENSMSQNSAPEMRPRKSNEFLNQSIERGAIEVSLPENDSPSWDPSEPEQRQLPVYEQRRQVQIYEQPNEQVIETKPKKKGFLRAFMRREKKQNVPKGAKTASEASLGANSLPNRPQPRIPTLPLPPDFDPQEMEPPRSRKNGRGGSPGLARSNSLERFRSKSMAQKFNRVLRLYDD